MRLDQFNRGDYLGAVAEQVTSESIVRVLYPNDDTPAGQELRLKQEYFFTSASLQDVLRRHLQQYGDLERAARAGGDPAQRHPSGDRGRGADAAAGRRARPRLERGLADHPGAASPTPTTRCCPRRSRAGRWRCWSACCRATCRSSSGSTRELLERARRPATSSPDAVALIDHAPRPSGAHGQPRVLRRAQGQRRLGAAHRADEADRVPRPAPGLSRTGSSTRPTASPRGAGCASATRRSPTLITDAIGDAWVGDLERLEALAPLADDAGFRERFAAAKRRNKERLAALIARAQPASRIDPAAMFDVHIKRIHEYKRQLLNILETIARLAGDPRRARPATGCRGSRSSAARRPRPTTRPS